MKRALIIGGSRGIGAALAQQLRAAGWDVVATGRQEYNVHDPHHGFDGLFHAYVFCAGSLVDKWHRAFDFPIEFFSLANEHVLLPNAVVVAVSSVAADRPAKVNPHYAAAKAALESYARTLADSDEARRWGWRVETIRFDLVETDMLHQLPPATLEGRRILSAQEAAGEIMDILRGEA